MAVMLRSCRWCFRSVYAVTLNKSQKQSVPVTYRLLSSGPIDPSEDAEPPIPPYAEKHGEQTELKRARLLYQSRKRGMLENGLLLSTFAAKHLDTFNDSQLKLYDQLINKPTNDWEIYYWATGAKDTPDEFNNDVMNLLKQHCQNKDKDSRIRQPDLFT